MPAKVAERFTHTLVLADGRRLGYADVGSPDGQPLVLFHGTPSSRLDAMWLDDSAVRTGWRLIAPDRPGHGLSSPHPDAAMTDLTADVAALADHLGLDRFAVLGYSGGAPHTLATARQLGERVMLVGLVSPWGPPDRPGAYEGVAWSERVSDSVARRAPILTRAMFAGIDRFLRAAPATGAKLMARKLEGGTPAAAPSVDALVSMREAFRQGTAGPARDLHLIVRPWGFDVVDLDSPVRVWHGDRDPEIPLHHGEHLAARVPDGRLEVIAGGDHLAFFLHADDILAGLARELR